jgi:hypothetical protein
MRRAIWVCLGVAISTGAYYFANTRPGQDSVESIREALRNDFLIKKGVKLTNVGFVRKSENELQGFAAFPMGLREVVKACIASRQNGDGPYSWTCY